MSEESEAILHLDGRVTRLESDVQHLTRSVGEVKADLVKEIDTVKTDLSADITELRQGIDRLTGRIMGLVVAVLVSGVGLVGTIIAMNTLR